MKQSTWQRLRGCSGTTQGFQRSKMAPTRLPRTFDSIGQEFRLELQWGLQKILQERTVAQLASVPDLVME